MKTTKQQKKFIPTITAAMSYSTEGLLDSLLDVLSATNGILGSIDDIELGIHEAHAEGEPVSTGANDVISLLDGVRSNFEDARETLLTHLDIFVGKGTPEPLPEEPEPVEEGDVEEEEEDLEELE